MNSVTMKSFAKINLSLDVLGVLPNGYHEVRMVMQTVSLCDLVGLTKTPSGINLTSNLPFLPTGAGNVAYAAAEAFFERTKIQGGVNINLKKRIPVGAGLAGGSGNAAAVLKGLNNLYDAHLPVRTLCEIASPLGADIPYCIIGGTRLAEGVGEKISPLPKMPHCHVVLVKPQFSISTSWAYNNIDSHPSLSHPDTKALIAALRRCDLKGVCGNMGNVLEDVSISRYDVLAKLKLRLRELGALGAQMSGSGPTVFGIFDDFRKAKAANDILREEYKSYYVCRAVTVSGGCRSFTPQRHIS